MLEALGGSINLRELQRAVENYVVLCLCVCILCCIHGGGLRGAGGKTCWE